MPLSATQLIDTLRAALEPHPWARALWLGGSAATGRTDDDSDVDLHLLVDDTHADDALDAADTALQALGPVAWQYRLPQPTWHGHAQLFIRPADTPETRFVDLVAIEDSHPQRFLEPERHGTPVVLFDKHHDIDPQPLDQPAHRAKLAARRDAIRASAPLGPVLVRKALRRGHLAEAAAFYQGLQLRPLIELLRMRHCPDRFDFGPRYLDRDVPPDTRATIERLALPADPDALLDACNEAEAMTATLLDDA